LKESSKETFLFIRPKKSPEYAPGRSSGKKCKNRESGKGGRRLPFAEEEGVARKGKERRGEGTDILFYWKK